ncbi:glutamate receptor ionotropic, delta-2-like isoform X2 [Prorops nasuta]
MMTLIHGWTRDLSRYGVVVLDLVFASMDKSTRYFNKIVRPLFVVLITSREDFEEFSKALRTYDLAFGAWLVLFWKFPHGQIDFVCKHPMGNPLRLRFNTEMMVLCENERVLNEWYSIFENKTERIKMAIWKPTGDFDLFRNISRDLNERRRNLRGRVLRAVVVQGGLFVEVSNGVLNGSFGTIIKDLCELLNFTVKIVSQVSEYGRYDWKRDKWSGAIGEIVEKRADIGIGDFSMTSYRMDVVDFTFPLKMSPNRIYYKQPSFGIKWSSYFKVFETDVWLSILILIITTPLLLAFMQVTRRSDVKLTRLISDIYLNVWGIFCQQGVSEFPMKFSLRLAYFSLCIAAFSTSTYYSARLISFLTVPYITHPFTTLEGFVKDGTYKLIVVRGTADYDMFRYSKDTLAQKMKSLMLPSNSLPTSDLEGFKMVCEGRLVFYTSEEVRKSIDSWLIPCKISSVDAGRIDSLAIALSKRNQFTGIINFHLQKFLDNGVLIRLLYTKTRRKQTLQTYNYHEVQFPDISPLLAILAGGIFFGATIYIMEKYIYESYWRKSILIDSSIMKESLRKNPVRLVSKNGKSDKLKSSNHYQFAL